MPTYSVIRFAFQHPNRTIATGLTLEQAQAMCNDPETSSRTAKGPRKKKNAHLAPWFYGYREE